MSALTGVVVVARLMVTAGLLIGAFSETGPYTLTALVLVAVSVEVLIGRMAALSAALDRFHRSAEEYSNSRRKHAGR